MSRIAVLGIGCLLAFAIVVVSIYWVLRDDNIGKDWSRNRHRGNKVGVNSANNMDFANCSFHS